ncbi:hypothetical protein EUX98_g7956 [Antrodiella citrinella]|uniref:F-box domain-containing protein n=1 Tax=Antrodiella citrinella TaxID=2447956 RepID=A0A4S4MCJ8_9APHY|nr:hypothetical protein EUX98_g7956 [Antrodiella citrinella]
MLRYFGAYDLPVFPPELVDQTIDYLHDDKPNLKTCSLVSRLWLNSTRHHIFRSTVIVGDSRPGHGFAKFRAFLISHPNIGLHIHELRLQGEVNLSFWRPQLQRLDIFGVRFGGCDEECHGRAFNPDPVSLDQITLVAGSVEDDFADTLDFLRLFGHVQHLYVFELTWCTSDMPNLGAFGRRLHELGPPTQLQVHSLATGHAFNPTSSLLCETLRFTRTVDTLYCLGAECAGWDHIQAVGDLVRDVGPNLLHLHMDPALVLMNEESYNDNHLRWRVLQAHSCLNLKTISLMIILDDHPFTEDLSEEEKRCTSTNIISLISTLEKSASLRHITIKFSFDTEEETPAQVLAAGVDWDKMVSVLNSFEDLEIVQIICADGYDVLEECRPVLLEKLCILHGEGKLKIATLNEENLFGAEL